MARDARAVARAKVRAQELLRFLVTEGIEPRRMRVRAVGAAEPVRDTSDKTAEPENTRVEFFIAESTD